jgi:hypothetical protein
MSDALAGEEAGNCGNADKTGCTLGQKQTQNLESPPKIQPTLGKSAISSS